MKAQYGSKKQYHYLYKTTNLINGKFYYGMHSTDNLEDGYKGSGTLLRRSIKKYGIENFKLEILEFFDSREALAEAEKKLVTKVQVNDSNCMNLKPGGKGGLMNSEHAKKFHSEGGRAVRQMMLERHKDRLANDPDYYNKWRQSMIGRPTTKGMEGKKHSEETLKKKSESAKGNKNSQFGTKWITNEKENKKIKNSDQIPEGWRAGRKVK
jgi:group I intron endonuclease